MTQELFDQWIDGIIAAGAAGDQQAWPAFALDGVLDRVFATEPRLPGILKSLVEGPVSMASLREAAGEDGKKLQTSIGRMMKWRDQYHTPSPLVQVSDPTDGVDINPVYRDALLARMQ